MKRASVVGLAVLIVVLSLVAACSPSPKARTDAFVKVLPAETTSWERDDKATVQLLSSTVSSKGHVILIYEGADDALAYIVIEAHPSEDAAEVAAVNRERELLLAGLVLDSDRAAGKAAATIAQTGRVRYALLQEAEVVVEINTIAADDEHPVSDEAFDELLSVVRGAYSKVIDD